MSDKKWMRIYETVEEALGDLNQTQWEKENNVTLTGNNNITNDFGDIKIIKIGKSTGENGICVLYKPYKDKNRWVVWIPSGNQQKVLPQVAKVLKEVDEHNSQFWNKNGEEEKETGTTCSG